MITLLSGQTLSGKAGTASAITYNIFADLFTTTDVFSPTQGQLPSSTGTLYPSTGGTSLIGEMQFANTTAFPVTGITFYIIGTGAANQINGGFTIPANGSASYAEGLFRIYDSTGLLISTSNVILTGDVTGSGAGIITTTLATVNSNVGSFGGPTTSVNIIINGKGLITSAVSTGIQIAESQVTNLITDLGLKANLAGPTFTGIPAAPTATQGNNSTQLATTAYVDTGLGTKQTTGNYITALIGDITASGPGSSTATLVNIPTNVSAAGSILYTNIVAPSTPAAGKAQIYVDSTSKNIASKNDAGVVNHGVQTKTATATQFLTAIADNGVVTSAQPANTDITGLGTSSTKNIGNTVLDPGTGKLEYAWPIAAAVTGANKTYASTDRGYVFLRSNSGSAMSDTLPALTNTTADIGWMIAIHNEGTTTTEILTMNASGGALFRSNSGGTAATSPINYGCRQMFVWSGTQWTLETGNANLLRRSGAIVAGNFPQFLDTVGNVVTDSGMSASSLTTLFSGKQATGNYITALTGDVTASGPGSATATVVNIPNATTAAGDILFTNIAAPGTPAAGKTMQYVDSTSKNMVSKNDAGVVNHGIQTRTATANNWIRSIADDGSTTISQPAATDITGLATIATSGSATDLTTGTLPAGRMPALTGDVTSTVGTVGTTVVKINGTTLSGLATGILKNTTGTGIPSIAVASDIPTTPSGSALGTGRTITTTAPLQIAGTTSADLSVDRTLSILAATSTTPGTLSAAQFNFLSAYNGSGIIFVTSNAYSNLLVDGSTDDLAALNTLMSNAPDGSTLVWPGQNKTMVLSGAAAIPSGKHFKFVGGGPGGKTHILQTSLTADHFTVQDWFSTFTGFDFMTNNTTTTAVQAYTSGTVLTINTITTALVPASGSINVGSAIGWQVLTYSARTATTVTLSSTGTGSSAIGDVVVFKTAGAAITSGNNVGIDVFDNTFTCCFNGYTASGSTSNQSTISSNGFLNTINFDLMIDAANWNGIIDSNTCDCTVRSRSLSHCEILQCGSITGQGNQFIRGQFNLRLGSTTAAYPAGVFGVYFTNSFFDNAGTDAVKVQGISAVQRVKLTSCWLSSAAANGLNFASTATTLPTDIELIGCNIYSNTTAGITGAGVADYKVTGGQIAGNGTGFLITAATGNVYSVHAVGVRVGPTGGIGVNTTALNIATGTYAQLKFADCDFTGNTTSFALGTITPVTASRYAITGCPGINPRGAGLAQPGVPTSTTVLTNTTGFRCTIFLKNGSTSPTVITVNGQAVTGFTTATVSAAAGQIFLDPGGTIQMTYTVAPTWVWIAN